MIYKKYLSAVSLADIIHEVQNLYLDCDIPLIALYVCIQKNLKVNQKTDLLLKLNVNQMKKSKIKASRIKAPANTINVHSDSLKGVDFAVQDFIQTIDRTQLQAGEPITTDATRISIQDKSSSPLPHSVAQLTI